MGHNRAKVAGRGSIPLGGTAVFVRGVDVRYRIDQSPSWRLGKLGRRSLARYRSPYWVPPRLIPVCVTVRFRRLRPGGLMPPSQCLWFEASSLGEKDKSSFDSRVRFPSVASTRCRLRAGPRSWPSPAILRRHSSPAVAGRCLMLIGNR
jgi:hypothetical protein